jgi:hypothetical protein
MFFLYLFFIYVNLAFLIFVYSDIIRKIDKREKRIVQLLKDVSIINELIKDKIVLLDNNNKKKLGDLFVSQLKIIADLIKVKDEQHKRRNNEGDETRGNSTSTVQ